MFEKVVATLNFVDMMLREAGGVAASAERMFRNEAKIAPFIELAVREVVFDGLSAVFHTLAEIIESREDR